MKVRILHFSMNDSLTVAQETRLVDSGFRVNLVSISGRLTRTIQNIDPDNADTVLKITPKEVLALSFNFVIYNTMKIYPQNSRYSIS